MRVTTCAILTVCAAATGAEAQPAGGMAAMDYFVGTWACKVAPVGGPSLEVSVSFVMDSGIMREWDDVLVPGAATPYTISKSITYDVKSGRWVQAQLDSNGAWIISTLKPWTGNTEEWLDEASSDGKLGRNETIRTSAREFSFRGYAKPTDVKPNLEGTCTRST